MSIKDTAGKKTLSTGVNVPPLFTLQCSKLQTDPDHVREKLPTLTSAWLSTGGINVYKFMHGAYVYMCLCLTVTITKGAGEGVGVLQASTKQKPGT